MPFERSSRVIVEANRSSRLGDFGVRTSRRSRSPRRRRGAPPAARCCRGGGPGGVSCGSSRGGAQGRSPAAAGSLPEPRRLNAAVCHRIGQPRSTATRGPVSGHGEAATRVSAEQIRRWCVMPLVHDDAIRQSKTSPSFPGNLRASGPATAGVQPRLHPSRRTKRPDILTRGAKHCPFPSARSMRSNRSSPATMIAGSAPVPHRLHRRRVI